MAFVLIWPGSASGLTMTSWKLYLDFGHLVRIVRPYEEYPIGWAVASGTGSPKTLLCRSFCKPLGRLNPIKRVLLSPKHESFVTER